MLTRSTKPLVVFTLAILMHQYSIAESNQIMEPTFGFGQTNLNMTIGGDFYYQPNIPSYVYVGASYEDLGFGFKLPDSSANKNDQVKGNSKYQDFHFDFYKSRIAADFYYQKYTSFYYSPNGSVDEYFYKNPNLALQHIGGDFYYVFSPDDYSMGTLMGKNRHQTKSGGSWIASIGQHFNTLNSPDQFVPPTLSNKYQSLSSLHQITTQHSTVTGGWAHNWVGQNWYGGLLVTVGGGPQRKNLDYMGESITNLKWSNANIFKMGFGYEKGNLRSGLGMTLEQNDVVVGDNLKMQFDGADSLIFLTYLY